MAATMLTAAATGLLAVGGAGAAAPADAAEHKWGRHCVLARRQGLRLRPRAYRGASGDGALINCNEWKGFCALAVVAPKGNCVALATRGTGEEYNGGTGRDRGSAMAAAPKPLYGGQIKFSYCM